jgi:uncharacterized protein (TIGR00730 family)
MVNYNKSQDPHYKKTDPLYDPWGKSCADISEKLLIEGPRHPLYDIWRLIKIAWDFAKGFHAFRHLGPCITIFGSARFREDHRYYAMARVTARLLARYGFAIMTGGGPGIMEAANRGAQEGNGLSVGCNITLPLEQEPNDYLDKFVEFNYFYARKVMLMRYSCALLALPGGFGTLDEVTEAITLIQTKKISGYPIVMMGVEYWQPFKHFISTTLRGYQTIGKEDLDLVYFTDEPADALSYIARYAENKAKNRARPSIDFAK